MLAYLRTQGLGVGPETKSGRSPASWATFEADLTSTLQRMRCETFLIISTKSRPGVYAQFARSNEGELRAEAVSNNYLGGPNEAHRLSFDAELALIEMGWSPPAAGDEPSGNVNFWRVWLPPVRHREVSALVIASLRKVYAVPSPDVLQYTSFSKGRSEPIVHRSLRLELENR